MHFRRWQDGQLLYPSSLQLQDRFGTPFYNVHRADFHGVLVEAAEALGVTIRLGVTVSDIDFPAARISLKSGELVQGDVVLGADGLNSACKALLLGSHHHHHHKAATAAAPLLPTGDLAYRLTVREADMRQHACLLELLEHGTSDYWMGPDAFLVGYLLKEDGLYNIALIGPDTLPEAIDVVEEATPHGMQELLRDWDPRLRILLGLVRRTLKWRMLAGAELREWGHESGRFVLLGDACHASLPYM